MNVDDPAFCEQGDGECDLIDLNNRICSALVPGSQGTLSCTPECTFDTSGCTTCGDGIRHFAEVCDCGTDPDILPQGCTDVNGGANANCDAHCNII